SRTAAWVAVAAWKGRVRAGWPPTPNWHAQENFTVATGYDTGLTKSAPYYDLYADFWNTWNQNALATLEKDCLNDTWCTDHGIKNIDSNYKLEGMPLP